ncbi:root meristem growth factor 2-like [Olea europaea var. sylvestris]|uniref:root meristem growth factor 2-like n=1 Tax=Olea europaea var. sylvestris TaxID=158386 RepID=UPI000C1D709E|nr:root meristem growth factor 2-like [Olea europaea var. sylvestris]
MILNGRRTSLLLLVLILIIGKLSNAYSGGRTAVERCSAASNKEAVLAKTSTAARENMMTGRKMVFDRIKMEKATKYRESEANMKISGAEKVATQDKDGAGFVAFNADYKGPRHHPPKNN